MLTDLEAMELLSRGHAVEWTGMGWKLLPESARAPAIYYRERRAAEPISLVRDPISAIDTLKVCSGGRLAALLREIEEDRASF